VPVLRLKEPITTPHGLTVEAAVWRWGSIAIDALSATATVSLVAYPTTELAAAAGTSDAVIPLAERRYTIAGPMFLGLVAAPPAGPTRSDDVSQAIYDYVRATDPTFADAEDVPLPGV
jgi:hypothetical protein